jgi:radical SAM protein with 4Fe4S-binding SPASM domain
VLAHALAQVALAPVREEVAKVSKKIERLVIAKLNNLKSAINNLKSSTLTSPLEFSSRLYHYERQVMGERSRIHLRVDPDESGLLIVNANRIMHLNPTATFMAYLALQEIPKDQALRLLRKRYRISSSRSKSDYSQFINQLTELIRPDGSCPIHDLHLDTSPPFSTSPSAPYRMDLALTYRCNNDCAHCYNARPRNYPEISKDQWFQIIDRLWEIGIPHIVFTGGEPTLRKDLPELITYAQQKGQVTGLNTNGRRLVDMSYMKRLVEAGLDHVQITVESHDPIIHDSMVRTKGAWQQTIAGLENALDSPVYVMTNTTMLKDNSPFMEGTLKFFASIGVPTIGLNALIHSGYGLTVGTGIKESELTPLLEQARDITDKNNQRLIWYTPTQYCNFDPMELELGVKGCTAALYNMCIEPDGGVIPCQSYYQSLGNLVSNSWESIWNHELSIQLRERKYISTKCNGCVLLSECGGGCPLTHLSFSTK